MGVDFTEGADSGNNTQGLAVASGLHVLGHLQHLPGYRGSDSASSLSNLKATKDIATGVLKGLALLEGYRSCQSVPVLADQAHVIEHDLLPVHYARLFPAWEGSFGILNGGT